MTTWFRRRSVFGAFASACVVAFAAALLWPVMSGRYGTIPADEEITYVEAPPRRPQPAEPAKPVPPPEVRMHDGRVRIVVKASPPPAPAPARAKGGSRQASEK